MFILEEEINKLGQDGWELVGGEKGYLYFKRQVMENETEIKRIYSGESNQPSTNNTSIRSRIGSVVYRIKVIIVGGLKGIKWKLKQWLK